MSYDVSFKAKLEGADQWIYVGEDWINHTSNTGAMIKEVCGSYPSDWDGKKCSEIGPVIRNGANKLLANSQRYRRFEPENKWGTVESTIHFLYKIADNCDEYPTAILEVDY